MLAGRGGGGQSAVAVFVARRRVCLETRGKHEWALSGLLLWSWIEDVRVFKGCSGLPNDIKAVLIFATKLKFTERATQSEHNIIELANEGHGEHRASREAGDGAHCGREGGKLTRTESVARWSREGRVAYEAEREALQFDFLLLDRCKVLQSSDRKQLHERGRRFFFFPNFIFIVFAVLLCRAVPSLLYIPVQHIKRGK